MKYIQLASAELIAFVMVDSEGIEMPGLGTNFTVLVSKNGAAFASGVGTKVEIGQGWYSYELTAEEADTLGVLAVVITAVGAAQQNLIYEVTGTVWEAPIGPYILTATEASLMLRCDVDDETMLSMLPMLDAYLEHATGHDWASDATIHPIAKAAAGLTLISWYDNPGLVGSAPTSLTSLLVQLEAEALKFVKVTFEGINGIGYITMPTAIEGATVLSVTGVYGLSGDQSAKFESSISEGGYLKQISSDDLVRKQFTAVLKHPADDVSA